MASELNSKFEQATRQDMASVVWAFGMIGLRDEALLSKVTERAVHDLEQFEPQHLTNLIFGFAAIDYFTEELFTNVATVAQRMDFQAQVTRIIDSFVRLRP